MSIPITPPGRSLVGLGAMRLSTERDRSESAGVAILHAAFDAGVTLFDTADAYCLDERDIGHNERLLAGALSTWSGDRSRITIATKGGMTRPEGRWEPDGRARSFARGVRTKPPGSGRRAHRALSAARARSAHAAVDQRPGARRAAARWPGSNASVCATSPSARSKRRGASPRSPRCRSS